MVVSVRLTYVEGSTELINRCLCSVDSLTSVEALSSGRHGLSPGCTLNVTVNRAFGSLLPEYVGPYRIEEAGLVVKVRAGGAATLRPTLIYDVSAVTSMSVLRSAAAPMAHLLYPGLKHRAIRIVWNEFRVEERAVVLKGCEAPTKVVYRRAVVTTSTTILYTGLATRFLCEGRCPEGQVCVDHIACQGAYDRVVSVIEGPESIVYRKGVSARMQR